MRAAEAHDLRPVQRRRCQILRLTLTGFRNYPTLRLEPDGSIIALTGANGAGKTNLLEAISLLAPGKGLRSAGYGDMRRIAHTDDRQDDGWVIAADIDGPLGRVSLGTGWSLPAPETDDEAKPVVGRRIQVAGKTQKTTNALTQHLRIVWLTPAMDRLFTGPAGDRRRFLDRLTGTLDGDHGTRVSRLERLMRQRKLVLENSADSSAWLDALEEQIAAWAIAVAAARNTTLDALRDAIARTRDQLAQTAFPWCEISLKGDLEARLKCEPAVRVEDEYRKLLCDSRPVDRAAGRSLHGPHRTDIVVTHGPKGLPAQLCSTGEQKILLIGIVLAHAQAVKTFCQGCSPALLLDEVAAHLDPLRREALFEATAMLDCQTWMTGTDAYWFEAAGSGLAHYGIDNGRIAPLKPDGF